MSGRSAFRCCAQKNLSFFDDSEPKEKALPGKQGLWVKDIRDKVTFIVEGDLGPWLP